MQQQRNLWDIISASEFEVPGSPPNEAARGQSRRLWRWFQEEVLQRPEQVEAGGSTKSRDCSADELDTSFIDIDWNLAARVLSADLKKRLESSPTDAHPLLALVAPPGCGIPDVLEAVAREQQLTILAAPPASELLGDENAHSAFSAIVGCVQQSDSGGSAFRAILSASRGGPGIGANRRRAVDVPPPRVARL